MSDTMKVQPFDVLLTWILRELETENAIFGIPRDQFYIPEPGAPWATADFFGQPLSTPIGPAAGPHTQLVQNIVCAWLTGGRFIELKTVQIMDELEIPRPCIDMEDEGYNVEWSQELRLEQAAREYVHAWALIHILRRVLGFEDQPFGTIFNMSVGYNLEGIQQPRMQRFMDSLVDASELLAEVGETLRARFPEFSDIEIPSRLTNSVTLSTMHGCPPDEIEQIARYLLEERGLHTTVKLNPTLLGKETVLRILHDELGYHQIDIPDAVFAHDLQYDRAVALITMLKQVAAERGLTFGVKLSNTLAMANRKGALPGDEMYMSGRALYPITMNLFAKLIEEFDGDLNVSYSAGADALNLPTILACGARPVTAASDLLKPGGYGRFGQYLATLGQAMRERGAAGLDELAADRRATLMRAAADALTDPRYKRSYHPFGLPKVASGLDPFDCIAAPCVEQCAVCQDVPEYAWWIAQGDDDRALAVILSRNPLPGVTGYVCTHLCQTRCTRNNYDEPVAIRNLKRFAAERGQVAIPAPAPGARRVAVVGSGPSGLAAAYYLALSGVRVTVFESREMPGGMLAIAPTFRLPPSIVQADIDRIRDLGVEFRLSHRVTQTPNALLVEGFDAVYLACGFQEDARLGIEGEEGQGVLTALRFLEQVARGQRPALGDRVLVIGGGNTAMDAARTAQRLSGRPATVVYRRSRAEMPAEEDELEALIDEGNTLVELASPVRYILDAGRVVALECVRNRLTEPDASGRRRPVPIEGSEFQIEADAVILAIGQQPDIAFLDGSSVPLGGKGAVAVDEASGQAGDGPVYAGGDLSRGPAIIIQACADGRRAAESICAAFGVAFQPLPAPAAALTAGDIARSKRARVTRSAQQQQAMLPVAERGGFDLVEQTLHEEAARHEAARCLQCSTYCDKCVEVCPNRANLSYETPLLDLTLPRLRVRDGELWAEGSDCFQIAQPRQILHLDDFCNECGNCATFCVHQGKPYLDKPRLFLQRADFEQETDNAFFVEGDTIWSRDGGRESSLRLVSGDAFYETDQVRVRFGAGWTIHSMNAHQTFEGSLSLVAAAKMAVVYQGAASLMARLG